VWNGGYHYKVAAVDEHENESPYATLGPDGVSGIGAKVPATSYLEQNYPNPFNPSTSIAFGLVESAEVSLRVYDAAGRLVRTLVDGVVEAKRHEVAWDGRDADGNVVATGVYFIRLTTGTQTFTRKAVLLK